MIADTVERPCRVSLYKIAAACLTLLVTTDCHLIGEDRNTNITDRYIITLKPSVDLADHVGDIQHKIAMSSNLESIIYQGITHQYSVESFNGYAGHFSQAAIRHIQGHEDVDSIEPDEELEPQTMDEGECCTDNDCPAMAMQSKESEMSNPHVAVSDPGHLTRQRYPPYYLHRISHRRMNDRDNYWYDMSAGAGTYAYILDSGINQGHNEFGSRARFVFNAFDYASPYDTIGHGTYIAGIIGGRTHGVAKKTNILGVKIIDSQTTRLSIALHGYQWAISDITRRRRQKNSVIQMSIAGDFNQAFNRMVDSAYRSGIVTVAPAGNKGQNARNFSPASASQAWTVGATDFFRHRAGFSNWGPQVSLFAPGVNISSAWKGQRTRRASGTASASAQVAGLVVYLKGFNLLRTPDETWALVSLAATRDVVKNKNNAPALFAYNYCGK